MWEAKIQTKCHWNRTYIERIGTRSVFENLAWLTRALAVVIIGLALGQTAKAANIQAQLTLENSGGLAGPLNQLGDDFCPTTSTEGCDFSSTDNKVRTHDSIGYKLSLRVDPPGDDVFVKLKLKAGALWTNIPGFCDPYTSTLTGDGSAASPSELYCDLGFRSAWAGDFTFPAKVMGTNPNNANVGISTVEFGGNASTSVFPATPPDLQVTATPRLDVKILLYTTASKTINGVTGIDNSYTFHLGLWDSDRNGNPNDNPDPLLGNEMITGPVTFTNDMSAISANSYVWECYLTGSASYPWPTYDPTAPERSVINAGSTSCSATGASATGSVVVTVSGADFSFDHIPTQNRSGANLSADYYVASFGMVRVFTPASDITTAGGSLGITNTFTNLSATSITGQSNYGSLGEDTTNNSYSQTLQSRVGSFSHTMRCFVSGQPDPGWCDANYWWGAPTTASRVGAGDGLITPEQTFSTYTYYRNNSFIDDSYAEVCAVFDTDFYNLVPYSGNNYARCNGTCGTLNSAYVLEYSASYVATAWKNQRPTPTGAIRDECNAPASEWHSSVSSALAIGPITKVRMRRLTPLPAGATFALTSSLKARTATDLTSYPNNTLFRTWGSVKAETTSTDYRQCTYAEGTATTAHSTKACGDRLLLIRALARIAKITLPNDSVNSVEVGRTVDYQLNPSFTSQSPTITDTLIVTDELPVGTEYVPGSAKQNGSNLPPTVTGTPATGQTLTWTLLQQVVNVAIAPITFKMQVPVNMTAGTILDNTARIDSNMDTSTDVQRSDVRSVSVSAPASLLMHKQVLGTQPNPNGDLRFRLTYDNRTNVALNDVEVIDIFPYNGDGRLPATSFSGTLSFGQVSPQSTNMTIYVTKDSPGTLVSDPSHTKNDLSTGQTNWCQLSASYTIDSSATPTIGGGTTSCPSTGAQVTAIRAIDHSPLGSNQYRDIDLTLNTQGNYGDDIYTNQAQTYANGVSFAPFSPYASITIEGQGELSAQKSVTIWDPQNEDLYALPGNEVIYKISIENIGDGPIDNNSILLVDKFPAELEFWNGYIDAGGSPAGTDGPVIMETENAPNMSFNPATDLGYSTSATKPTSFSQCQSRAMDQTFQTDITYICIRPAGQLPAGMPKPKLHFSLRGKIK